LLANELGKGINRGAGVQEYAAAARGKEVERGVRDGGLGPRCGTLAGIEGELRGLEGLGSHGAAVHAVDNALTIQYG